jgi:hypothetical protein
MNKLRNYQSETFVIIDKYRLEKKTRKLREVMFQEIKKRSKEEKKKQFKEKKKKLEKRKRFNLGNVMK